MQITLLPPLLPTEPVTPVTASGQPLVRGMKVVATVLTTGSGSGTQLSLFGRHLATDTPLPHPPGSSLELEVVEGGARPLLRVVGAESPAVPGQAGAAAPTAPPVSSVGYGLAAAVLAARGGADVPSAAAAVARWIPLLVGRDLVPAEFAARLLRALSPLTVASQAVGPGAWRAHDGMARDLASRMADGGLLLERRLADVVQSARPDAEVVAGRDVRASLAALAEATAQGGDHLQAARAAITHLQHALLAEQARTAAHLGREGLVDVRVPLQADGHPSELRLRMRLEKDAPDQTGSADATPWRHVTLDLALSGLGRVHVRLSVGSDHARAEFVVEEAGAADRIEGGLAQLSGALEAVGFTHVLSRVVVDPVRVSYPDELPSLPGQHSIVDTRA